MIERMPVTMQGSVPYPPNAEAAPLTALASDLRQMAANLGQQGSQVAQVAQSMSSSWTGSAADAFVSHLTGRAVTLQQMGTAIGGAVAPIQTFAAAITSTQAAYSAAATAEQAARAGMPWTAAALAAAIAAEAAAVGAHQAAGAVCGAAVGMVVAKVGGSMLSDVFLGGQSGGGAQGASPNEPDVAAIFARYGLNPDGSPTDAAAITPAATGLTDTVPGIDPGALGAFDTSQMPNTDGMSDSAKWDVYAQYFQARGIDINDVNTLPAGQRIILGLRVPTATTANRGTGEFDDRIVVLWRGNAGGGESRAVREFRAATDPSAQYDSRLRGTTVDGVVLNRRPRVQGEDANWDRQRDLGRLPAGEYTFQRSTSDVISRGEVALRVSSPATVERDVNHDGLFNQVDRDELTTVAATRGTDAVNARMSAGTTILFHRGGNTNTYSGGCQTFNGRADWDSFWQSLGPGNDRTRYRYVLQEVAPAPAAVPSR